MVLSTKPEEEKMSHTPYIVFREQGQWAIKSYGVHYGPYATQRDAIRAAVDAAHEAGRKDAFAQFVEVIESVIAEEQQMYWQAVGSSAPRPDPSSAQNTP
jgi:hypothetical protein